MILSVFNGFDKEIRDLYSVYDPDLVIRPKEGKFFEPGSLPFQLKKVEGIVAVAPVIEENALIRYGDMQTVALVRGINADFFKVTQIDCTLTLGGPLKYNGSFALFGRGLANKLALDYQGLESVRLFIPDKNSSPTSLSPDAFRQAEVFPTHEFAIQQEVDAKTLIIPEPIARELFQQDHSLSEIGIKTNKESSEIKEKISPIIPQGLEALDRYEQKKAFNDVMKKEKQMSYIILTFILLIASFNLLATLTMIILEKKDDLSVMQVMGAPLSLIRNTIFSLGFMISLVGTIAGLILGALLVWLQEEYGLVGFGEAETMIIDSYPVAFQWGDFWACLITGLSIGFINTIYPAFKASRISTPGL